MKEESAPQQRPVYDTCKLDGKKRQFPDTETLAEWHIIKDEHGVSLACNSCVKFCFGLYIGKDQVAGLHINAL